MHHDATWYGDRPQLRGLCVRWGPRPLPKKGAESHRQFSARVYCGQTAGWMKMALGMEVGLGPWPHCARLETNSLSPKRGQSPQFSAHFYCRQTAGCIKMSLGMEVGLSLGDFMLDGDPASPLQRGTFPAIFGQCPLWPNDWME